LNAGAAQPNASESSNHRGATTNGSAGALHGRFNTRRPLAALATEKVSTPPGSEQPPILMRVSHVDGFVKTSALLLEVSHTGASMVVDAIPDQTGYAFIQLECLEQESWAPLTIVRVTRSSQGPHLAHVEFRNGCPYSLFKVAVFGRARPRRRTRSR
jgi:hypothetical protein